MPVQTGLKKRCHDVKGMWRGWMGQAAALQPYHLLAYHGNWYFFARKAKQDQAKLRFNG